MRFYFTLNSQSKEHELDTVFTIGRRQGDLILSEDPLISGAHLRLFVEHGKPFVQDLGSSNGTLLNDSVINANEAMELKKGDVIKIGSSVIKFQIENFDEEDKTNIEIPAGNFSDDVHDRTMVASSPQVLHKKPKSNESKVKIKLQDIHVQIPEISEPLVSDSKPEASQNNSYLQKEFVKVIYEQRYIVGAVLACAILIVGGWTWKNRTQSVAPSQNSELALAPVEEVKSAPPVVAIQPVSPPDNMLKEPKAPEEVPQVPSPVVNSPEIQTTPKVTGEAKFLSKLEFLKKQYKKAKSPRVKEALMLDAHEFVVSHFKRQRVLLTRKASQSRSPASNSARAKKDLKRKLKESEKEERRTLRMFSKSSN